MPPPPDCTSFSALRAWSITSRAPDAICSAWAAMFVARMYSVSSFSSLPSVP